MVESAVLQRASTGERLSAFPGGRKVPSGAKETAGELVPSLSGLVLCPTLPPDLRPGLMNSALNGLGCGDSFPRLGPKSSSHAHTLKPASLWALGGTADAVPFPKSVTYSEQRPEFTVN